MLTAELVSAPEDAPAKLIYAASAFCPNWSGTALTAAVLIFSINSKFLADVSELLDAICSPLPKFIEALMVSTVDDVLGVFIMTAPPVVIPLSLSNTPSTVTPAAAVLSAIVLLVKVVVYTLFHSRSDLPRSIREAVDTGKRLTWAVVRSFPIWSLVVPPTVNSIKSSDAESMEVSPSTSRMISFPLWSSAPVQTVSPSLAMEFVIAVARSLRVVLAQLDSIVVPPDTLGRGRL